MPRSYADMILFVGLEHPRISVSGGGRVLESIPCGCWILREGCMHRWICLGFKTQLSSPCALGRC